MPIFDRKLLIHLGAIAVILIIAVFSIRFFSGDEDTWLCVGGEWVRHGVPEGGPPNEACGVQVAPLAVPAPSSTEAVAELSPDEKACLLRGGKVELRRRGDGQSYAVCVLFGGKECEISMFRSEQCPPQGLSILGYKTQAARYCIDYGGEYRAVQDRNYRTPKENGTCKFLNGRSCPVWDFWNGKCTKEIPPKIPVTQPVIFQIDDTLRSTPFDGTMLPDDALIKTYGATPDAVFKKNPSLLTSLRRFIPGLNQNEMAQGFPSVAAELKDKRKLFVFSGCSFDGCIGTLHVAAYDPKKRVMYLLTENENRSEVHLFGTPDDLVKSALLKVYFSLWQVNFS